MVVKSCSKRYLSRGIDPSFLEACNGVLAPAGSLSCRDPAIIPEILPKEKACPSPLACLL
jgi:hypothetical protein